MDDIDDTDYHSVVIGLTSLIRQELSRASSEQSAPMHGADQSDDKIKEHLAKAKAYRRLRDEFEQIYTGAIV